MKAIEKIEAYLEHPSEDKKMELDKWLGYLVNAEAYVQNMEHVNSVTELTSDALLKYVHRTLEILEALELKSEIYGIIETVLKWSDVAKGGSNEQIAIWKKKGYNLTAHNEGSASIYMEHINEVMPSNEIVELLCELIRTHGLIGQYLRGESELKANKKMTDLLLQQFNDEDAYELLYNLNACVIGGVSNELWNAVKSDIQFTIKQLLDKNFEDHEEFVMRISKLRKKSHDSIDNIAKTIQIGFDDMKDFMSEKELWYVESSLKEFSFADFWTLFRSIRSQLNETQVKHIHFGRLMNQLYYDYQGKKHINVYRKRIIEKYVEERREDVVDANPHVSLRVDVNEREKAAHVYFEFSPIGEALINFCVEAEKVDIMHSKASVLLYDFFGLRKDDYDRLHNEKAYLSDMNSAYDDKRKMLDYLTGETVVDIGPGGGVLLDMIEEETKDKKVIGIDISENVIRELNAKKEKENRKWEVKKADALNLSESLQPNSIDTIIFSSVIHELFSYIPYNGKRFNYDTIAVALKSAFNVLKPGGRIVIRDGIMDEETNAKRIIRFKDFSGMKWLSDYQHLFKGRQIQFEQIAANTVIMPVNDALEFLYTYTWGDEAFSHEVNEQFAYFTPKGYQEFVLDLFGESAQVVHFSHYLQEGYPQNLNTKVNFMDTTGNPTVYPDSTCLMVIEKKSDS